MVRCAARLGGFGGLARVVSPRACISCSAERARAQRTLWATALDRVVVGRAHEPDPGIAGKASVVGPGIAAPLHDMGLGRLQRTRLQYLFHRELNDAGAVPLDDVDDAERLLYLALVVG